MNLLFLLKPLSWWKCIISPDAHVDDFKTNPHPNNFNTFFAKYQPLGWFRWFGGAHVILCVDSELIFSTLHYVAGCESVVEDAICDGMPLSFTWITLHHHVMQPVIAFLIWRWRPWNGHSARNVFINLHWTWWFGLIWKSKTFFSIYSTFIYSSKLFKD